MNYLLSLVAAAGFGLGAIVTTFGNVPREPQTQQLADRLARHDVGAMRYNQRCKRPLTNGARHRRISRADYRASR